MRPNATTSHALGNQRRLLVPVPAAVFATLAMGLAPSAALADGELVSRADGPTGAPFVGTLIDVSEDGQAVLMNAPGDVGGISDLFTTAVVRNRTTDTVEAVLREDGPTGLRHTSNVSTDSSAWNALSISPDGKRVLIATPDEDGAALVVRDLVTKTTRTVSTLPSGAPARSSFGVFVDGGAAVLYTTVDGNGQNPAIYRRSVAGGAATLLKSGATLTSATRDGSTFTWVRELPAPVRPPETDPQLQSIPSTAVGYTTVGGASRVVERTSLLVRVRQGTGCAYPSNVLTSPRSIQIDAAGRHLWWSRRTVNSPTPEAYVSYLSRSTQAAATVPAGGLPFGGLGYYVASIEDLSATGDFALVSQPNRNAPLSTFGPITGLGGTPWTPPARGATPAPDRTYDGRLFAQDRGYVSEELGASGLEILAFDPTAAVPAAPAVLAPKANASDVADDPALKASVKVEPVSCGGATTKATVGVTLASPMTTAKPAGTVAIGSGTLIPSTVKLTVKTLGFTTWSKTVNSPQVGQSISLPHPWWLLPQTVTVTASYPASGDSPATSVTTTRGWTAQR